MNTQDPIQNFLDGSSFAVVGASKDRSKYGNKVLRAYLQNDRKAFPVNPSSPEIEGIKAFPDLASLPEHVHGISVITPPPVTKSVVEDAIALGIKNIWMQPGSEDDEAVENAKQAGINVIANGPCILVALRFQNL